MWTHEKVTKPSIPCYLCKETVRPENLCHYPVCFCGQEESCNRQICEECYENVMIGLEE